MSGSVPEWDTADRMRKALRVADIGVQEIAEYLGVSRNTVSTWINGRIAPSTQTLRLWALRCGVDFEWLAADEIGRPRRATRHGRAASYGYHRRATRRNHPALTNPGTCNLRVTPPTHRTRMHMHPRTHCA